MNRKYRNLEERLFANSIVEQSSGCWLWIGARHPRRGYGVISVRMKGRRTPKVLFVHRVAYETLVGPIQRDRQIDHVCRIPHCINPAHLEPVTREENLARRIFGATAAEAA